MLYRKLRSRSSKTIDDARFNVQDFVNERTNKGTTCPPCNF